MTEILQQLFGYGYLGGILLLAALAALVWVTLGVVYPKLLIWPVLITLAAFPASSLLIAESGIGFDVYGKGAGYLVLSLFEITFVAAAVGVTFRRGLALAGQPASWRVPPGAGLSVRPGNPLSLYYWLMAAIVAGYVLVSVATPGEHWQNQFSRAGVVYLLLQGVLVAALLGSIESRQDLRRLMTAVALVVALRMLWGAVRYVVLNGDPASYYESEGDTLKITFWDVNDSIWAVLLAASLVWLAATKSRWRWIARMACLGFALLCLGVVALSARRTAQGGAVLALIALALLLPKGRRVWVLLLFAVMLPLAAYKLQARSDDSRSWFQRIFNAEQKGLYQLDPRRQRFYELKLAMQTVARHPVLGVGPAGEFNPPSSIGLEYHHGNYHFVHSGFAHVLLKTGVIGLLVFCGLLLAYFRAWLQQWREAPHSYRVYLVASACSFAAGIPNLAFGTPMIESRTMYLMGLGFALPLMVARVVYLESRAVSTAGLRVRSLRLTPAWSR